MKTTIQLEYKTLARLRKLKMTKKESYNEVIIRLMNNVEGIGYTSEPK